MTYYVLVITLIFAHDRLDLPAVTRYDAETCTVLGKILEQWLTQDGVRVEWKCVRVDE
jgi:hypothetical protein